MRHDTTAVKVHYMNTKITKKKEKKLIIDMNSEIANAHATR